MNTVREVQTPSHTPVSRSVRRHDPRRVLLLGVVDAHAGEPIERACDVHVQPETGVPSRVISVRDDLPLVAERHDPIEHALERLRRFDVERQIFRPLLALRVPGVGERHLQLGHLAAVVDRSDSVADDLAGLRRRIPWDGVDRIDPHAARVVRPRVRQPDDRIDVVDVRRRAGHLKLRPFALDWVHPRRLGDERPDAVRSVHAVVHSNQHVPAVPGLRGVVDEVGGERVLRRRVQRQMTLQPAVPRVHVEDD